MGPKMNTQPGTHFWFIVSLNEMNVNENEVDFHITNYKVVSRDILSKKYKSNISNLRFIAARDYKAGGGVATGTLIMYGGKEFNITYNWMGISTPENLYDRKTYTIQVKGEGIGKRLERPLRDCRVFRRAGLHGRGARRVPATG